MESLPVDLAREAYAMGSHVLEVEAPALARIEDLQIPNRGGHPMPARLYAPVPEGQAVLPVLVFFHGGGFVVGSVETHDTLCRVLSHLSGCAVLSVDYRLAPEHKFPAAFNDAWDAVLWLTQHAAVLGLDETRIAVGGDSAGGTLAAGCAVQAALAEGSIDPNRYGHYLRLRREVAFEAARSDEHLWREREEKWLRISKLQKTFKKQ